MPPPLFSPLRRRRRYVHPQDDASQNLLVMAQHHMLAFIIMMYILILICEYGFGWTPGSSLIRIPVTQVVIVTRYNNTAPCPLLKSLPDHVIVYTTDTAIGDTLNWGKHTKVVTWNQTQQHSRRQVDQVVSMIQAALHKAKPASVLVWIDHDLLCKHEWKEENMIRHVPVGLLKDQVVLPSKEGFLAGYREGWIRWIRIYQKMQPQEYNDFLQAFWSACDMQRDLCFSHKEGFSLESFLQGNSMERFHLRGAVKWLGK